MSDKPRAAALLMLSSLLSPWTGSDEVLTLKQKLANGLVDWEELAHQANRFGLAPALYCALRAHDLVWLAPDQLRAYLEEMYRFNTSRNAALLEQLSDLVLALNRAGVTPMLLKGGAALATGLYPDPACRFMWDLDVLVPERQFERSMAALLDNGYMVPGQHCAPYPEDAWQRCHHGPPLVCANGVATVELHRRLLNPKWRLLSPETVWAAAVPCAGLPSGAKALVLAPEHELLHCFAHSQLHHEHHRYSRIDVRHLYQFAQVRHRHNGAIDQERLVALRSDPIVGPALRVYLTLARRLFGVPLPLSRADAGAEQAVRHLLAIQDGWSRRVHCLCLTFRALAGIFDASRMREIYGDSEMSINRLRLRRFRHLLGKYWRISAWQRWLRPLLGC